MEFQQQQPVDVLKRSLYYAFVAYDTYIYDPEAVDKVKGLIYGHDQDHNSDDYPKLLDYAIFKEDDTKRFYVTFRGSTTTDDWLVDLSIAPANMFQSSPNLMQFYVHSGFLSVVQSSFEDIKSVLTKSVPVDESYTLLVTGHSLGAACAQVFAWLYSTAPVAGLDLDTELYTFAAPQILWSKPEYIKQIIPSTKVINVVNKNDIVPRLLGSRTTDLAKVMISEIFGEIASFKPFQKYLQHLLDPVESRIITSYVPGQDITLVVPITKDSTTVINMSRYDIIKESVDQAEIKVVADRLCITTPLKDITVEAHYQANYLNGFVANKLRTVKDFQGFFIVCAVPDQAPKEKEDDTTLYLDVNSDTDKVVLQLQAIGDRSSQIWNIDSDGYLVNRAYPSKKVGYSSPDYGLVLVDKNQQTIIPVTWDVQSLYEGFFTATNVIGYVLTAPNWLFEKVTVGTYCELKEQGYLLTVQQWSLQLAHEQK